MKIIKLCIFTITVCCVALSATYAQTADEIIQKHIDAIGGIDNWKKINSIKIIGTSNAGGTEIPITLIKQQGKGFKVEYTVNGMTGYSIITDKTGWSYNPFGGQTKAEVIPDETIKQSQDALDIGGPLIDYKAKGNKITYLGKDDVEGTECYKIKVTFTNGKEQTIYIDAVTYYHIRTVDKIKANDKEMEQTSNYGNFQKLPEGIVYAMSIDNGGGPVTIKSIEINKPIDENVFKPAEVKATEPKK
jgi:outer membrane lipoprotein-sorting protein